MRESFHKFVRVLVNLEDYEIRPLRTSMNDFGIL
jgi:hypothetical protein